MSSEHAKVVLNDKGCFLLDLESRNGTVLDGERVPSGEPQKLVGGERIGVGSFELEYVPPHLSTALTSVVIDPAEGGADVLPPSVRPKRRRRRRIKTRQLVGYIGLAVTLVTLIAVVVWRVA